MTNLRISGFRACFVFGIVILGACSSSSSNGNSGGQGGGGQAGSSAPAGPGGTGSSHGSGGSTPAGSGGLAATGTGGSAGATTLLVPCEGTDLTQTSGEAIVGTVPGSAVLLDGTNWITLPETANYVAATGFTWELWFMGTSLPTDETVGGNAAGMVGYSGQMLFTVADPQPCVDVNLGFGDTFAKANMLAFKVDGPATCNNRDIAPVVFRPTGGFQNQRWYHVAAVRNYDAGCAGLYLDGVLVASKTTTLAPIAGTGFAASIGRWTDGGYDSTHFKGALDEVRIYSRALSAREIADHYNGGLGRPGVSSDPGLVAGYHLDEASGTSAADFGPAKLDGQYVNTPGHVSGIVPLP